MVPVLFTFYIQGLLKLKKNNFGAERINYIDIYRSADNSLARPGRKHARKHVREERDFNNIETGAVIKIFFLQGKAPKEIHAILAET